MSKIIAKITSGDNISVKVTSGEIISVKVTSGDTITCKVSASDYEPILVINPWTPLDLTNLVAWYDASNANNFSFNGNYIQQWNDNSENNKHSTQSNTSYQPTYDSVNQKVVFTNDYMKLPNITIQAGISVVNNASGSAYSSKVCFICGEGGDVGAFLRTNSSDYTLSLDGTSNATGDLSVNGEDLEPGDGTGKNISSSDSNYVGFPTQNETDLVYWQWTDTQVASYLATIGAGGRPQDFASIIDMHETILLSSTSSLADRQKLEGYLAHKWNFTDKLPAGHPYKITAP